jgi:hypothetical protein
VLGGLALGSLAGATLFELSSRTTYNDSKIEPDPVRQDALYDSANRKYKLAQGFAIGGAALAIGAAIVWFSRDSERERPQVSVTPTATSTGLSLSIEGSF